MLLLRFLPVLLEEPGLLGNQPGSSLLVTIRLQRAIQGLDECPRAGTGSSYRPTYAVLPGECSRRDVDAGPGVGQDRVILSMFGVGLMGSLRTCGSDHFGSAGIHG